MSEAMHLRLGEHGHTCRPGQGHLPGREKDLQKEGAPLSGGECGGGRWRRPEAGGLDVGVTIPMRGAGSGTEATGKSHSLCCSLEGRGVRGGREGRACGQGAGEGDEMPARLEVAPSTWAFPGLKAKGEIWLETQLWLLTAEVSLRVWRWGWEARSR